MKTTLPLLCLAMLFIACRQNTPVNQTPALAPGHTDSAGISPQQKKINDSLAQLQDSLVIEKMLVKAIGMAETYRQTEFSFSFSDTLTDNMKAYTDVTGGRWFSKNKRYVKVKREASSIVYTDIFEVRGIKLVQVLHNDVPGQTHLNDTVMDINGDGLKDFAVHWYPSSGCCARDRYDVYIFNPKTGAFADKQEFINPTFSPKEKVVRGYEYGHYPGMYKYKWNGFKIDTVEYVYADTVVRNKYYITSRTANNLPPEKESGIKRIIYKLPAEYKNVGFDYASHIISSHEKLEK